jgi:adenylate cyclase
MLEAVDTLNVELRQEQGEDAPRFAVGVGINTGDCVVGNVGSRWRYDYSVLGDTVNLASRLESLSKEYGVSIVLGPTTAKALQEHFVLIELDRIAVKGRAEKTAIFTILAPAAQQQDPALAKLMELHPTVLASIGAGRRVEALELVRHCQTLAPSLSKYYGKLLLKATAIPE